MMKGQHRLFLSNSKELFEAARLIDDDNLVWDEDFEGIRKELAAWLRDEARNGNNASLYALAVAKRLNRGW